jgi:predicted transcription factor, homolog of eukaryotic MBF1
MNLGMRIRQFRNMAGLSQEKLAWKAGIAPAFLGQLERGLKSPTVKTLEKLTRALGIPMAELFSGPVDLSDEKDTAIKQIVYQIRDLPVESIQNLSVIIQQAREMATHPLPAPRSAEVEPEAKPAEAAEQNQQ